MILPLSSFLLHLSPTSTFPFPMTPPLYKFPLFLFSHISLLFIKRKDEEGGNTAPLILYTISLPHLLPPYHTPFPITPLQISLFASVISLLLIKRKVKKEGYTTLFILHVYPPFSSSPPNFSIIPPPLPYHTHQHISLAPLSYPSF